MRSINVINVNTGEVRRLKRDKAEVLVNKKTYEYCDNTTWRKFKKQEAREEAKRKKVEKQAEKKEKVTRQDKNRKRKMERSSVEN